MKALLLPESNNHSNNMTQKELRLLSPVARQLGLSLLVIERRSENVLHQRLLRFAGLLRLRTSNGFGRGAPLICSEDSPAIVRRCSLTLQGASLPVARAWLVASSASAFPRA